jgi:hypothetical protein
MPRPMTLALSALCVGLVGLSLLFFFKKDRRPITVPPEMPDPVAQPVRPGAIDSNPEPRPSAVAVRRRPQQPDAGQPASEESLLAQLHELAGSNPDRSLELARDAVKRFPDSPNAPEFEWNVVKALFNMGRLDEAEAEARVMLSKYPGSSFTGDVVHHLLNHPPNPSNVP